MTDDTLRTETASACGSTCSEMGLSMGACGRVKKFAGTLTGKEIQGYKIVSYSNGNTIPPEEFQATTFDLRLGEGHYLYDESVMDRKWQPVYIGHETDLSSLNERTEEHFRRTRSDHPYTLIIPPFGSALVQLYETVDTLSIAETEHILLVGRFDLKLSNVHQGLISQQATQVEPCYRGKLFCFLHNLSNNSISLEYKQKIATIEFSYVSCLHDIEKCKSIIEELKAQNAIRYQRRYCDGKGIEDIRYFFYAQKLPKDCGLLSLKKKMEEAVQSPATISAISDKVKLKIERTGKIASAFIGAFVALLLGVGGYYFNYKSVTDTFNEKNSAMQTLFDKRIAEETARLEKMIKERNATGVPSGGVNNSSSHLPSQPSGATPKSLPEADNTIQKAGEL